MSTPFTFDNQIPKFNERQMLLVLLANIMVIGRFITFIGKCMFYLVPFRHCCCILKEQALARIISGAVTEDYFKSRRESTFYRSCCGPSERREKLQVLDAVLLCQLSIPVNSRVAPEVRM